MSVHVSGFPAAGAEGESSTNPEAGVSSGRVGRRPRSAFPKCVPLEPQHGKKGGRRLCSLRTLTQFSPPWEVCLSKCIRGSKERSEAGKPPHVSQVCWIKESQTLPILLSLFWGLLVIGSKSTGDTPVAHVPGSSVPATAYSAGNNFCHLCHAPPPSSCYHDVSVLGPLLVTPEALPHLSAPNFGPSHCSITTADNVYIAYSSLTLQALSVD